MEKEKITKTIKEARGNSKKRNFTQTVDLIATLKDLNLKKPEEQVDSFIEIPHKRGRDIKVCALVGAELKEQAEKVCDKVITQDDFPNYEKKDQKKLANSYDFFVAQANIMQQIAKTFGRVFGPRGKMPNPKAGCVVPPKANLKQLYDKLQKTVRVQVKTKPMIQIPVGKEDMNDEEIAENISTIYSTLTHNLPKEENNVKSIMVKLTMGKPARVKK